MGSAVKQDRGAVLVIGYGNRLRGDDAVGPLVAEAVAAWRLPGVETIAVHQLTPELAERLAEAGCAVFVDATTAASKVAGRRVRAGAAPSALGHALDPGGLLGLALQAFGRAPVAWLLTVPTGAFEVDAGLSPVARAGLDAALKGLRQWIDGGADHSLESHLGPPPSQPA